jgi:hypothetical protein
MPMLALTLTGLKRFDGPTNDAARQRLNAQRRPLSNPAFETRNGTTKFKAHRTHVAVVA